MKKQNILNFFVYCANVVITAYLSLIAFILTQIWVNDDIAFRVNEEWWLKETLVRFFQTSGYGLLAILAASILNKFLFYWISKSKAESTKLTLRIAFAQFCTITLISSIGSIIFFIKKPYI